jgi:site-specific DNA recombinase
MRKGVVIYARISVTREESVSVSRQIEAATKLAEARGWTVVGVFKDDGVSASANRPEDRKGWCALLESSEAFDAVIVWKIDRLARRVLDFLHANEALEQRGAGIVAVEDPIDMTTPTGKAFATMLAVFGEMEAEAIRARVKAARAALIKDGRVVGGTVPYGWQSIPNPGGPGLVLAHDPQRIGYVREAAERVLKGDSIYSLTKWLDAQGAPLPNTSQRGRKSSRWAYSTVERMLRNPILAGMTTYNPGNTSKQRGRDVLRDADGLPVIDESVAVLTREERRRLLAALDARTSPQARPRASRNVTSPLLSRMVTCGGCNRTMHRGTTQGRPSYSCPGCYQTVSRLEDHVIERFLEEYGFRHRIRVEQDPRPDDAPHMAEIEASWNETVGLMKVKGADRLALAERLNALEELQEKAGQTQAPGVVRVVTDRTYREDWEAAQDDSERREVLQDALASVTVSKGKVGRYLDPTRVAIEWISWLDHVADIYGHPTDEAAQ